MPCPICGRDDARRLDSQSALYRCRRCRAVYWEDVWDPEQVRDYYRGYYEARPAEYDRLTEKRYHAILDRFEQLGTGGCLLDVGCGAGGFLSVAEARGWRATGIEVSQSAVESVERIRTRQGFKFGVVSSDLLEARFPEETFDAVTLFEVIEHVSEPAATLNAVHRVLKAGGIVYLTTPNFDSLPRYILGRDWRVIAPEHRCLFSPGTLRAFLVALGFRPITIRTKNLDVPAILAGWKRRCDTGKRAGVLSDSRRFRETVEAVPWLRRLKAVGNAVLGLVGLGETVEALAVKVAGSESKSRRRAF